MKLPFYLKLQHEEVNYIVKELEEIIQEIV